VAIERNVELKVGIFVVIGIVIFFILVFSIGDITFVKEGYHVKAVFNFVDGITKSSPVRYAGVDAGHVDDIRVYFDEELGSTKVEVSAWINDPDRKIEKGAVATINTLGLLGEKYIEIFPGDPKNGMVEDGGILEGRDPIMMRNITDKLGFVAESACEILGRIRDGEGTIGKLLVEEKIYKDLEELVADIKAHPWKLLNKPRGR